MFKNRIYFYGSITGTIGKFGYSAGIGGLHIQVNDATESQNAVRLKGLATLNYALNQNINLNYQFLYEPSNPVLSEMTEQVYQVNRFVVRKGNMHLTTSEWLRNRISARFSNGKFTASLSASHSHTNNPIYTAYRYIDAADSPYYGMFLQLPLNGRSVNRCNIETNIGFTGLLNHINLQTQIGWDRYCLHLSDDNFVLNKLYMSIFGSLYFDKFVLSANYDIIPQRFLTGNIMSRSEIWNTIRAQYRWNGFTFSMTAVNLFARKGSSYHNQAYSSIHPEDSYVFIRNCGNLLLFSVSYRLNFGEIYHKKQRTLVRATADTGIDNDY